MADAGQDGDFLQLQIVRERRKKEQAERKANQPRDVVLPFGAVVQESADVYERPSRPSTAVRKKAEQDLREKLFEAVDKDDKQLMRELFQQINKGDHVSKLRDPATDQNVLHYTVEHGSDELIRCIIELADDDLLLSFHDITKSGIHGKNNALHIITEKNDLTLAKLILNKLSTLSKKMKLIQLETAVDIQGQRPRLFSCLHLAAFFGNKDLVLLYLDTGVDVNHLNGKKDTALLWAARWGHDDTVIPLLDRGADPDVTNDKGSTALYWAVRYGFAKTVSLLLTKGKANPNTIRKLGLVAPIILASAYGNTEVLSVLLQHPAIDINVRIRGGDMAIHHAAKEGNLEVLEMLIKRGANPNEQDELGDTPLLLAAKNGHVDIVRELLGKGVNINHRNHEGNDAWYFAIESEDNELMYALVNVTRNQENSYRQPLGIAARSGRCDKLQVLLKMNVDPAAGDLDGNTFLHHAAMTNQHEIIDKFHSVISINSKNKKENTPLHIACFRGYSKTVESLITCKAKSDMKNDKGETALHVAAYSKHITAATVRLLVDYTIKTHAWESLNAKDNFGNNSLHIAGRHAKPDVLWEFRFVRFKDRDEDGLIPLHEAVRPNEPEALEMMLDIFESMKRDARINEQTYVTQETVLQLAALEGHANCVRRLIELGADVAVKDVNGDTVLHKLVKACISDGKNTARYMDVLNTILENIVKWWCIKEGINFPEEENRDVFMAMRREAILFVINDICNKEGLSVLEQAFKSGASEIISRLLMMPGITMFEGNAETTYNFDITGLTPRANNTLQGCCGTKRIAPLTQNDVERRENEAEMRLSGLEWLISQRIKTHAAEIMDIPPIRMIENYYRSIVAWTFALLMIFHITYMSVFTYVAVDLLGKLRDSESDINSSDPETLLLYVFVPLEPLVIIIYVLYTIVRYFIIGEIDKRSKLSQKRGVMRFVSVISSYLFLVVCALFSGLVFTWIGLFTARYRYQDYFLATAICIGWLLTIAFTRGIRLIHYFYRMLLSMIIRDVVRFIIVYLFVLMAFGFAFHVLFQVSSDVVADYKTPGDTLFLTFNMMIGMGELFDGTFETNLSNAGREATYIKLLYIAYMVLGTIVLLNLLIAMMNDSYTMILKNNQVTWRIESVNLGVEIESNFPICRKLANVRMTRGFKTADESMKYVNTDRWFVEMSAAEYQQFMMEIERKYTGSSDDVSKRLEELEERTIQMEREINNTLQHILAALEVKKTTKK